MEQQAAAGDCFITTGAAFSLITALSNVLLVGVLSWFRSRGSR